jgi:hypothetical protein
MGLSIELGLATYLHHVIFQLSGPRRGILPPFASFSWKIVVFIGDFSEFLSFRNKSSRANGRRCGAPGLAPSAR